MFIGPEWRAFYNDAYGLALGQKHPSALAAPAKDIWAEIWDEIEPLFSRVMQGETISAKDRPFAFDRSGEISNLWFDLSYSPIRDETGAILGIFCIVAETTDRVLGERALRESQARLRAAINGASVGIASIDEAGQILLCNHHFADLFRHRQAELSGASLTELVGDENAALIAELLTVPVQGSDTREFSITRQDRDPAWVALSISQIGAEDPSLPHPQARYSIVARDVTERRRETARAKQMAAIIEGSEDAILAVGLDTRITSWNAGAAKLYGYREDEVLGRPISFLLPPDRKDDETEILGRIRRGQRVDSYETTRLHRLGHEIPVSLTVSPILDEYGTIIGASKIARDISNRKAVEKMQNLLMREMQHRVKNILATVLAIARQSFTSNRHHSVAAFTDRIYALARAQGLLTRDTKDDLRLAELVGEVVSPYPGAQVMRSGPDVTLPSSQVLTLTLALHELATNAAKYGALSVPEGKVTISWDVSQDAEGAQVLSLSWRESGGPRVIVPETHGFGTRLIRDILTAEFGATIRLDFAPDGLVFSGLMRLDPELAPHRA